MKTRHPWLFGACLVLAACGEDAKSGGDGNAIKLGVLAPKSGELAEWGRQMERSSLFAADEINRAGGIDGRKIELIIRDTAADPEQAVKAARELLDAGVVAFIGPATSAESVAVVEQVSREAHIPTISPGASSPQLTTLDDGDTFFRTAASDAFQGKVLARRIHDDGHAKLAIIYRDDAYGAGLRDTLAQALEELGGQVSTTVGYPADKVMNFGSDVAALFPDGDEPDAVALLAYHEDGANITRDIQALGLGSLPSFYGVDGVYSVEFAMAGAAPVVDGLIGTAPAAPTNDPNFIKAQRAFADLTGAVADFQGASYDAVCIVALARASATEVSSQGIIDQLRQVTRPDGESPVAVNTQDWHKSLSAAAQGIDIDYAGASGPLDLDDVGDVARGSFVFWQAHASEAQEASIDQVGEPVAFP
jgi:branched-chain amino acid transport system substrate-binding protein